MESLIKKMLSLLIAAALCLGLCSCRGEIEPTPPFSEDVTLPTEITADTTATPPDTPSETKFVGELYGSYLTMYFGRTPIEHLNYPKMEVFETYAELDSYYMTTLPNYFYGKLFTLALANFTDDFLAENDLMLLLINEPSSYVNHTAEPIEITDDEVKIKITRHISEGAPRADTQYHLIFTAPKGAFVGIEQKKLSVEVNEVVDPENNSAFDAESFRMYRPEFWNFCYRADPITDSPKVEVDAIDGYSELIYFFDKYRSEYDLDSEFAKYVGTLYSLDICERYIILATIIPTSGEREPAAEEVFVNNLEIFLTVGADTPDEGQKPDSCYLLLTAVERSDLTGVNLDWINLSFE